jgi:asparagine synthase (glutamine-hydrolysing)
MCRIAGIINFHQPINITQNYVSGMCDALASGGPDASGIFVDENAGICLGHRRLAIIDLSQAANQPMYYANQRFVISFNGEIYNYQQVQSELKGLGYSFETNSDTEVILAAYAHWGTQAFERFNGMYAFAIYDKVEQKLVLTRDPAGIKPLYYAVTDEGIAFASEVKALKLIPYLQTPHQHWKVYFLAYGHLPEPITTLQKVQPLAKGNCLVFEVASKKVTQHQFAKFKFSETHGNREEVVGDLKNILKKAVGDQLIADAPIGVFLSGGLDSSIIAYLASLHTQQLNTNSIFFENEYYSEKKFQDLLKKDLNCTHHQHKVNEQEFHDLLPEIIQSMDLPCCDGINTWFISKFARECGLKAVLSGIGGDELFGGYPSFKRINTALNLQKSLPNGFLKLSKYAGIKQLRRLCYLSIPGAIGRYLFLRGQFVPSEIASYLNLSEKEVWDILAAQPVLPAIDELSASNQVSWMELNMYMQNQLLRDADVMSMAHGVEIRVPFLDNEVYKYSLQIQSQVKYAGSFAKQLLIDAFKENLPEPIWNRPKMGFAFPFKEWFGNDQFALNDQDASIKAIHQKLKNGEIHWSQYYSLLLVHINR